MPPAPDQQYGVRPEILALLEQLRVEFGMSALSTLWPVGVRAIAAPSGPTVQNQAFRNLNESGILKTEESLYGWDYSSPQDQMLAREYLLATFPDRVKLAGARSKCLGWPGGVVKSAQEVPYVPPPKGELIPEWVPDPTNKSTAPDTPKVDWAKDSIGISTASVARALSRVEISWVCVLDTGVDLSHPYLLPPKVTLENQKPYKDVVGHGTRVCGMICGGLRDSDTWKPTRTAPMRGLLPRAATTVVQVFRPLKKDSKTADDWYLDIGAVTGYLDGLSRKKAKNWDKIWVLNMSFGLPLSVLALYEGIAKARLARYEVVAAVGNTGDPGNVAEQILYPAAYTPVVSVGALSWEPANSISKVTVTRNPEATEAGEPSSNKIDVYAPGDILWCCNRSDDEEKYRHACWSRGTSYAAPLVSAAWAYRLARSMQGLPTQDVNGRPLLKWV